MDTVVFAGYHTQPILLAAVCNRPNTWLVTMSGYQTAVVWWVCVWSPSECAGRYGQTTGIQEIFATSLGMQDNYSFALVQHLLAKHVPDRSDIILAGHSLGGMVAQSLPVNPALGFSSRWRTLRVLTFGAPVMYQGALPPAEVRRFATQGYVFGVPQDLQIDPVVRNAPLWIKKLQLPTPVPFDYPAAGNTTMVGVTGEWFLPALHVAYPKSADLRGFDALGNSPGGSYLQLDASRMWRLPVGTPFPPAPPAQQRGLTATDDVFLQSYARTSRLVLIVRDANPWSERWVGKSGYAPKPKVIKAKTLKPGDCADTRLLGLAAERTDQDAAYYASLGFVVAGPEQCFVLSSPNGTRYYSDADLHGVYRSWLPGVGAVDQWRSDSIGLARALNRGLSVPLIQHGPQDDWSQRNSHQVYFNNRQIENGAYGPLPPATAYLPEGGTVHLENRWQMKEFYLSRGIDWPTIYPNPDEQ
jgi:pimeloyl-ACP methyl ester carboxylesterase